MLSILREQLFPLTGMVLLVVAYFIAYRNPSRQSSRVYIWLNIIGSGVLAAYAIYRTEPMFFLIEAFWFFISILLLFRKRPA